MTTGKGQSLPLGVDFIFNDDLAGLRIADQAHVDQFGADGAVVVLVLFALMLTRSGAGDVDTSPAHRWLAAAVGAGVTVLLGGALVSAYGWSTREVAGPGNEEIGAQIFGTWVWPFELLSLLLLAALVAAVAVATTGHGRDDTP